jgi:hypothetical protein
MMYVDAEGGLRPGRNRQQRARPQCGSGGKELPPRRAVETISHLFLPKIIRFSRAQPYHARSAEDPDMTASFQLPLTGGCQCGGLRYAITAAPMAYYLCHCTECQRQSGSAFAGSMFVARADLKTISGSAKMWRRRHESGRLIDCVFCPDCGTRLWHLPELRPNAAVLKPGTLDDTSWLRPVAHIFTRSAPPWIEIPAGLLSYPASPGDMSAITEAWRKSLET